MGPEDELIARYQQVAGPYTGADPHRRVAVLRADRRHRRVVAVEAVGALHALARASASTDPQFHKDIGFYVFQLPFLKFIAEWLFAGLVIVLIVTAVAHYLNGGIRFQSPFQRVTPQVKAHLSVILAVMALVKTAQYYLGRFELNFSTRGVVEGASYTDVKAQLPALNLLIFISIVAAALFLWNIRRRGWVLPIIAVGLWGFVSLVIGTIYPAADPAVQGRARTSSRPRRTYIDRNIRATRDAFGLDEVEHRRVRLHDVRRQLPHGGSQTRSSTATAARSTTRACGTRASSSETYHTLQNLQTYYQIGDVDVDRYLVDNETRQVLIAARGLNSADLPSQSFVNRHIVYTHGYGVVASPSNEAAADGIARASTCSDMPVEARPGIDARRRAAVADLLRREPRQLRARRRGAGGVQLPDARARPTSSRATRARTACELSNFVRRAAFALRFGSLDPLISGQITSKTKVLMERDIRARVAEARAVPPVRRRPVPGRARRPHAVGPRRLHHDRHVPVLPVARAASRALASDFNYVRNSVKVDRRRLRGHGHLLRVRQDGPDHPGVAEGVPRPLHRRVADAGGAPRAPALPGGPLQGAGDQFGRYHVTEPQALLRRQREVAGVARPRLGSRCRPPTSVALHRRRAAPTPSSNASRRRRRRPGGASIRTTSTSSSRSEDSRALHRHRAVRAGVVGQQP